MKTKYDSYKDKVLPRIKRYTENGSANDKEASAIFMHTVLFQNTLVEDISSKFDSVEKDVKGLNSSLKNVESRLSPLETTVKKVTEEDLPQVRTQVRALSTEVRDVSKEVNTALTSANTAKELAESVRRELETHVSSEETAKKLTTITKALDDIGQELRALAQKVASIPSAIPMDLGAVEEMIKNELKKLGFLPAGQATVPKPVKETISSKQVKLDADILNLGESLTLAFADVGLVFQQSEQECSLEESVVAIEGGLELLYGQLGLPWSYTPEKDMGSRVKEIRTILDVANEAIKENMLNKENMNNEGEQ